MLRRQDRTEDAAERYVQRVLRSGADQAITAARMRSEHVTPAGSATRLLAQAGSLGGVSNGAKVGIGAAAATALLAVLLLAR